jgi:GSCFA family protein
VKKHPYTQIGEYARWDSGVAKLAASEVDPVVRFPLQLTREQSIVTAGSCFAQHIARYLKREGFKFLVTEPGHPLLDDATRSEFNYGVFSARYGNVYTSRQLVQLFRRVYGELTPDDQVWEGDGFFVDPFRPTIQPKGFPTLRELELDREQHFAAVRRAFEELEVLIFTFGLTECWAAQSDGTVFPIAPGVAGGVFDPDRYEFLTFTAYDVFADTSAFIESLREVNPGAEVILTVSPVPLFATAVDRHVLVSTTYSKSVLRVAAEHLVQSLKGVYYFPSYEIVTGNFSRGAYFATDLRSILEPGVEHVMSLFFRHAADSRPPAGDGASATSDVDARIAESRAFEREMEELVEVLCDEELLRAADTPGVIQAGGAEPRAKPRGPKALSRGGKGAAPARNGVKGDRGSPPPRKAAPPARKRRKAGSEPPLAHNGTAPVSENGAAASGKAILELLTQNPRGLTRAKLAKLAGEQENEFSLDAGLAWLKSNGHALAKGRNRVMLRS